MFGVTIETIVACNPVTQVCKNYLKVVIVSRDTDCIEWIMVDKCYTEESDIIDEVLTTHPNLNSFANIRSDISINGRLLCGDKLKEWKCKYNEILEEFKVTNSTDVLHFNS